MLYFFYGNGHFEADLQWLFEELQQLVLDYQTKAVRFNFYT